MFFNKDDRLAVKTEALDVMILKFERNGQHDLITAKGARVPNEVNVQIDERVVGRATLHVREDGIHADIMLGKGSMTGMTATAIVYITAFDRTLEGRTVTGYEIKGVGLTPEVDNVHKDTVQKTERSQDEQESK